MISFFFCISAHARKRRIKSKEKIFFWHWDFAAAVKNCQYQEKKISGKNELSSQMKKSEKKEERLMKWRSSWIRGLSLSLSLWIEKLLRVCTCKSVRRYFLVSDFFFPLLYVSLYMHMCFVMYILIICDYFYYYYYFWTFCYPYLILFFLPFIAFSLPIEAGETSY